LAKVVQETFKSCPTLDMEVFTVLTVYDHFSIPFFLADSRFLCLMTREFGTIYLAQELAIHLPKTEPF
jgi:hypothetical protein